MSACNIVSANNVVCVIIVTHSNNISPVGIITEHDIVEILGKLNPVLFQAPLRILVSKSLVTIEQSASINDAVDLMSSRKIRRLAVVDKNNKIIGLLTQKIYSMQLISTPVYFQNSMEMITICESRKFTKNSISIDSKNL